MILRTIPSELSFSLYSTLETCERTADLRIFLSSFAAEFGDYKINSQPGWKKRMNRFFDVGDEEEVEKRDGIICKNGSPIAIQQFSLLIDKEEAYAEGVFVDPLHRERGLARLTREVLFYHLLSKGIQKFYIGQRGPISKSIRRTKLAQALAERDLRDNVRAIIDLKRTPACFVQSYGFNLEKYNFSYNVGNHSLGD
jgi:uncharacterized protein (DUF488 family)